MSVSIKQENLYKQHIFTFDCIHPHYIFSALTHVVKI